MNKQARFLLDTNVISHAVKADWNKPEISLHWINRRLRLQQDRSYLPSVAVQEIISGIHRNRLGPKREASIFRWLNSLPKLDYDVEAAKIAGKLESDLKSRGITIDKSDVQIAAIALRYDLTLVTNNVKHFNCIPGLRIVNWADMPITAELFLKEYIFGSLGPINTLAAIFIAFLALALRSKSFRKVKAGSWLMTYLINVFILAVVTGVAIASFALGLTKLSIELRKRKLI